MKVLVVLCAIFVATQANPAFRALRARASGLGAGGSLGAGGPAPSGILQVPPAAPGTPTARPLFQPVAAYQSQQYQAQPQQYQPQPQQYQAQPQQFQPRATSFGNFPGVPFGGYQQG